MAKENLRLGGNRRTNSYEKPITPFLVLTIVVPAILIKPATAFAAITVYDNDWTGW